MKLVTHVTISWKAEVELQGEDLAAAQEILKDEKKLQAHKDSLIEDIKNELGLDDEHVVKSNTAVYAELID